jgi:anti-sigma factor RsiW
MIHMTIQQLSSYLDAELSPDAMERVGIHLSSCEECTSKFNALERHSDRLAEALRHDPDDVHSSGFEEKVEQRILNGKRMTAPRPAVARTLPPLPEAPPVPLPRASSLPMDDEASDPLAPSRIGAAVGEGVKRTAQTFTESVSSFTRPRRREEDPPRHWPFAWGIVAVLAVIAGGVGMVVGFLPAFSDFPKLWDSASSRQSTAHVRAVGEGIPALAPDSTIGALTTEPLPGAPPAYEVVEAQPASPTQANAAPPNTPPATSEKISRFAKPEPAFTVDMPADEDEPAGPSSNHAAGQAPTGAGTSTLRPDELGAIGSGTASGTGAAAGSEPAPPLTPAETAKQLSERAASDPSVSSYEAAAKAWDAALASLHGDQYQYGRWRIAEARYRAWQMDSDDGQRAARANTAIRAYLIAAPPGDEREQARAWLTVIRDSGFRYTESR